MVRQLYFSFKAAQVHLGEGSDEWIFKNEVGVFSALENAEESIAYDARQFDKFKEGDVVNQGTVKLVFFWAETAYCYVSEDISEIADCDFKDKLLIDDVVEIVH